MPEQITKYPEVTLEVLKGAGARCGIGIEQRILKKCPRERFCALPTGEICVYGITDIPQMTQISAPELARVVCPQQSWVPAPPVAKADVAALGLTFAVGMLLGRWTRKRPAPPRAERSG
ncbi:MAG: hypothetical protein L0170_03875 [Acidobacteria bacterium]|nr:hypothetical protein [Acidobacteriota bacterium]